jgi:WD40 repeat protein
VQDDPGEKCRAVMRGHKGRINAIVRVCTRMFSASNDGTIRVWDIQGGRAEAFLRGYAPVKSLVASGSKLFSGSSDGTLSMLSVDTLECKDAIAGASPAFTHGILH